MTRPEPSSSGDLRSALATAATLWDAACVLLKFWRESPSSSPARHSAGDAWTAWADTVNRTQQHFAGPRAAEDLIDDDRRFLLQVTAQGRVADAVDAAAWGLANATSHTFAPAWPDAIGVAQHTLSDGELYPVADAPWVFEGSRLSPRPASLTTLASAFPVPLLSQLSHMVGDSST
jgi:hypothetical protein